MCCATSLRVPPPHPSTEAQAPVPTPENGRPVSLHTEQFSLDKRTHDHLHHKAPSSHGRGFAPCPVLHAGTWWVLRTYLWRNRCAERYSVELPCSPSRPYPHSLGWHPASRSQARHTHSGRTGPTVRAGQSRRGSPGMVAGELTPHPVSSAYSHFLVLLQQQGGKVAQLHD